MKCKMAADQVLKRLARQIRKEDASKFRKSKTVSFSESSTINARKSGFIQLSLGFRFMAPETQPRLEALMPGFSDFDL